MALRSSSGVERPDHTRLQVGSEGQEILQSNQKSVTRKGSIAEEADFDIDGFDLNTGDFDLSSEKSGAITGSNPDTGGADMLVIFLESDDDKQFSVSVEWKDDNDTTVGTVDNNIDSDLISTSPTGGNHHVYVSVSVASDRWNLVITDEASSGQNRVTGSVNVH